MLWALSIINRVTPGVSGIAEPGALRFQAQCAFYRTMNMLSFFFNFF